MGLAEEVAALKRRVAKIERGARYATGGSIENSALLVRDGSGALRAIVGQQADGTTAVNVVNGGPPPAPSAPTVESAIGGLAVGWDGTFAGGEILPLDWQRVEVHASPTDGFTPSSATLQATIETPQGAIVYLPADGARYVRLMARNTSGTASDPTPQVGPVAPDPTVPAGSITATEIADDAVTTPKIFANAVTTAKLAVGSVDATAIAADAITGKTITGGQVNGAVVTGGELRTAASGKRVLITPDNPNDHEAAIVFYSGSPDESAPGYVSSRVLDVGAWLQPEVHLYAPQAGASVNQSSLLLRSPIQGSDDGHFRVGADAGSGYGSAYVQAYSAGTSAGTSTVEMYAEDGPTAAGGGYCAVKVFGNRVLINTQGALHEFSPTGLFVDGDLEADNFPVGAWTSWTPTWTTSTGANTPSFGNATKTCEYTKVGRLVIARFEVVFGTTTNFGGGTSSDNWRFSLPVEAASTIQVEGFMELNQSTGARCIARARGTTTTVFELEVSSGRPDGTAITNLGLIDAVSPWTWASGNAIRGTLTYQSAS